MPPRPYLLETAVTVAAPLGEVFAFFSDAGNLDAITPAFLSFRIVTERPIEMRAGTLIDYRLKVRGLPVSWRTRIDEWDPPHRFVDVQVRGPYRLWHHTHEFCSVPEGTEVVDRVRMLPPGGPLAPLVFRLLVERDVRAIFAHRGRAIAERFGLVREGAVVLRREPG